MKCCPRYSLFLVSVIPFNFPSQSCFSKISKQTLNAPQLKTLVEKVKALIDQNDKWAYWSVYFFSLFLCFVLRCFVLIMLCVVCVCFVWSVVDLCLFGIWFSMSVFIGLLFFVHYFFRLVCCGWRFPFNSFRFILYSTCLSNLLYGFIAGTARRSMSCAPRSCRPSATLSMTACLSATTRCVCVCVCVCVWVCVFCACVCVHVRVLLHIHH